MKIELSLIVFGNSNKSIKFSLLELSVNTWELPTALFHVEYSKVKKKWYFEVFYSNKWLGKIGG
jgi:hypothetical protein